MYRIKAPNEKYERKIGDIRFVKGEAETNDPWLASWFSGRLGFTVETVPDADPDQKDAPPADEDAEGKEKSAAADPSDADAKPKTRKGRKKDDEGNAAGETGDTAADGAAAGD